jgi:hypothetical protein
VITFPFRELFLDLRAFSKQHLRPSTI